MEQEANGVHEGHRARIKKRFLDHGLDNFDDHEALELLLFYAVPRGDLNPLAHTLIRRLGSFSAVFDAPFEELIKISGVGENTATFIKLIAPIARRYHISRSRFDNILSSSSAAGSYLLPRFFGERDEVVYALYLDAKCKVLSCRLMFRGSVNSASVNMRKLVENALATGATSVIIAHNHTSGIALPSEEDKLTTRRIEAALHAVDIALADHIIVADDDFVSLADSGFFG